MKEFKDLARMDDISECQEAMTLALRKWKTFAPNFTQYLEEDFVEG